MQVSGRRLRGDERKDIELAKMIKPLEKGRVNTHEKVLVFCRPCALYMFGAVAP